MTIKVIPEEKQELRIKLQQLKDDLVKVMKLKSQNKFSLKGRANQYSVNTESLQIDRESALIAIDALEVHFNEEIHKLEKELGKTKKEVDL